ncbi:MAG: hypothetical protein LAO05_09510 [Acidobacteriia bacterium]|nr:hypothetical protein [Terriglobia bacterium]
MHYLMARHRVADFDKWSVVFRSHAGAQRQAGLHVLHLLRGAADPNLVVILFRADDPAKARAFTEAPGASEAAEASGVIGTPEISLLRD